MKNLTNVLVGIDFSSSSAAALKEALRIARWNKATLTAMHVLDKDALNDLRERVDLEEEAVLRETRARLEKFVDEAAGEGDGVKREVTLGHPFLEILEAVESQGADLLVLGSRGSGRDETKTGILASRCVRKAPVRVLLVRERQEGPFRKVAACVDFSKNSELAVEQAAQLAAQDEAELHLIHVFQPVAPGLIDVEALAQPINPLVDENYIPHLKEKMLRLLEPLQKELPGLNAEAHVIEEIGIGHGIVDCLNEIGADLVVLGTRGRTGLKVILMGTTAERVIHDAPCSALAIKPEGFSYHSG